MMIMLNEQMILLQAQPANKREAIRLVGQLLAKNKFIDAGYIDSMFAREEVANTYLGNGITIPHGLPKDRDLIKQTGIAVVQIPAGVAWNAGETACLVVGIAARSDEHIDILRRLTRVLGDKEQVQRLIHTTDRRDIVEALTGERPITAAQPVNTTIDTAPFFEAIIPNKTGLHARPASAFVDLAKRFQSEITVYGNEINANGKSLLSILQLGIERGSTIRVSANGADASTALQALQAAIAEGLGDDDSEEQATAVSPIGSTQSWKPQTAGDVQAGIPTSGGLAIGPLYQYIRQQVVIIDEPGSDPIQEGNRFQSALTTAQSELGELYNDVKTRLGPGKAAIFQVHTEFLNDSKLIMETVSLIYKGHTAAWSWQSIVNERMSQMQKINDPLIAERAVDLRDAGQRVLRHMVGEQNETTLHLSTPGILIAPDLAPSDTVTLDRNMILGLCTARGGPTSHTAILARGLGIPAMVSGGDALLTIPDGTLAILDGESGNLYLKPSAIDLQSARAFQQAIQQRQKEAQAGSLAPAITSDGHQIEVAANINLASDAAQAVAAGAEGVGLMRTEVLFLGREEAPSEEEQFEAYKALAQALQGRPLVIRTLDIGGDKEVPYLNLPKEENAFLGMRGIRLCLSRKDLFIPQLRAIYRASAFGRIQIMFPMISTLEDVAQARAIAEEVRQSLNAAPVPLGIMIEVPSAVMLADELAQEVDFFSIGTNDLTQYTLAMDRLHPQLARQADALHPAVLRMIDRTVQAARKADKWVGVCGGVAGDPKGALILAGLGVSELSISVPNIAEIKAHIRNSSFENMQIMAQRALQCRTAAEVRSL